MKKLLLFSFLTVFLSLTFVNDAEAQRKKKSSKNDQYFDESGNFASKLWYGAGFVLNFGTDFIGTNAGTFRGNTFLFGLSPMVGYEFDFIEGLSAGPRLELLFRNSKYNIGGGEDLSFNSFDYGVGAFARYKFPGAIFIHTEYQRLSEEVGVGIDFNRNEITTTRAGVDNFFIGGGYSQGDIVGFEISILWNLAEDFTSDNIPIYYRFGINYKFN